MKVFNTFGASGLGLKTLSPGNFLIPPFERAKFLSMLVLDLGSGVCVAQASAHIRTPGGIRWSSSKSESALLASWLAPPHRIVIADRPPRPGCRL